MANMVLSMSDIVVADIVCGRYRRSQWRNANVIVMKAYDYNFRYYPKSNTRGNKYIYSIIRFTTIHENILSLPIQLTFGIACLILLLMLILSVCSKHI